MKKYRVYVTRQVEETLEVLVEAKTEKAARKVAKKYSNDVHLSHWTITVKDIDYDICSDEYPESSI